MNVRPVKDYLLIQPSKLVEEKTSSGLYLPRKDRSERYLRGKVLAMGRGKLLATGVRAEPEVRVGDEVVIMTHHMAQRLDELAGDDAPMLVPETDVIAVLEG